MAGNVPEREEWVDTLTWRGCPCQPSCAGEQQVSASRTAGTHQGGNRLVVCGSIVDQSLVRHPPASYPACSSSQYSQVCHGLWAHCVCRIWGSGGSGSERGMTQDRLRLLGDRPGPCLLYPLVLLQGGGGHANALYLSSTERSSSSSEVEGPNRGC
ncbi:hypothetical protein O3P69_018766 [Scylla paramamosain]|uniref:Uncharacterized protein n=1 Tax=Scylla paramamosain TaxID=85552 RepID=A0AAW0SSS2_SCYPA